MLVSTSSAHFPYLRNKGGSQSRQLRPEWKPQHRNGKNSQKAATPTCCEACEPCDLLWKLTFRGVKHLEPLFSISRLHMQSEGGKYFTCYSRCSIQRLQSILKCCSFDSPYTHKGVTARARTKIPKYHLDDVGIWLAGRLGLLSYLGTCSYLWLRYQWMQVAHNQSRKTIWWFTLPTCVYRIKKGENLLLYTKNDSKPPSTSTVEGEFTYSFLDDCICILPKYERFSW